MARLERMLAQKEAERSRVVGLYRRGRLTDADLDAQMDEIGKEETSLEAQIDELRGKIAGADSISATVGSAQALLAELRKRLDEPVSWEQKRRLVEILVSGIRVETVENCGVKQANTTITYRFSQPTQAMPITLPRSYNGGVVRIPAVLNSVGDHIRRRRLGLKLLQREVAEQLGVNVASLVNWEGNLSTPHIQFIPAIITFLGYDPLPAADSLGDQLVRHRTIMGLNRNLAAKQIGVDAGTLSKWERGERQPTGAFLTRVNRFLNIEAAQVLFARRAG